MKKKVFAVLLTATIFASGCKSSVNAPEAMGVDLPIAYVNEEKSVEGGILHYGLVDSNGFKGLLESTFYDGTPDGKIINFFQPAILRSDDAYLITNEGAMHFSYDLDKKTVTFELKEELKWHDGVELTLDDLLFAYEVIAHGEYNGSRYTPHMQNIVGIEDYHDKKADHISGITLSEDKKTMTIQMKELYPAMLYIGTIWHVPMARHYWEGVAVKDMTSHDKMRVHPLGWGPYKVVNIIPGEAVEMEAFEDFHLGKPKLDKVIVKVINPDLVPMALKDGTIDIADRIDSLQYLDNPQPGNFKYLSKWDRSYSYLGFKLGKWDHEKNEVVYNPESKMADVNLRHAIGYAINEEEICEQLYNGFRVRANTIMDLGHEAFQNKEMKGFYYDPEKAKQILDEAGYLDVNNDGFREDKNGNPLIISYSSMQGGSNNMAETIANTYIQNLADVGLKVELYGGRLQEFNTFYSNLEKDVEGIDMYSGAWGSAANPSPSSLYKKSADFNYPRYTSERLETLLNNIDSEQSFDYEYMMKQYMEFQEAFFEEAPVIPTEFRKAVFAVNNRVKNFSLIEDFVQPKWHLLEMTAEEPYRSN